MSECGYARHAGQVTKTLKTSRVLLAFPCLVYMVPLLSMTLPHVPNLFRLIVECLQCFDFCCYSCRSLLLELALPLRSPLPTSLLFGMGKLNEGLDCPCADHTLAWLLPDRHSIDIL